MSGRESRETPLHYPGPRPLPHNTVMFCIPSHLSDEKSGSCSPPAMPASTSWGSLSPKTSTMWSRLVRESCAISWGGGARGDQTSTM